MRVLVGVLGDQELLNALGFLRSRGYTLAIATTLDSIARKWRELDPIFVILKGVTAKFGAELRPHTHKGFVLAIVGSNQEGEGWLTTIGDCYIQYPFEPSTLLAWFECFERRMRVLASDFGGSEVRVGPLVADQLLTAITINGKYLRLLPTEAKILRYLIAHVNEDCLSADIQKAVWGEAHSPRLVGDRIRLLRRKMEANPANPRLILTVKGGYRLTWDECDE
jgi:DNA-binding response OmpR family regulator